MNNRKQSVGPISLLIILSVCSCTRIRNPLINVSPFPEAEQQNISSDQLVDTYSTARSISGIKSLLVGRNGVLVAEEYFNGQAPDSLHDVRSVTKSLISMLIGIAVDKGFIANVDQPIGDFLDSLVKDIDHEKKEITIRHLLTMTGGFEWAEFGDWSGYN